jgi:hypothetical protein
MSEMGQKQTFGDVGSMAALPLKADIDRYGGRRVLCFKSALRPQGRDQQDQEEGEQRDHSAPTLGDSLT